jgi:hypothetical protein
VLASDLASQTAAAEALGRRKVQLLDGRSNFNPFAEVQGGKTVGLQVVHDRTNYLSHNERV